MKYIKNFETTDEYTSAKTSYEYPTVTLVTENDTNDVYYMGKPYWKATFTVTADDITNSVIVPIYLAARASVSTTDEEGCQNSALKTVYYNGEDVTARLSDTTVVNGSYTFAAKGWVFDSTETAGDKEFIFIFTDSYHLPTACWANCSKLKSAECSEAVEIVPAQAFYNTNIGSINIGKEVKFIGQQVTAKITSCSSLTFEEGGKEGLTIGQQAFSGLACNEIVLPERIENVAYTAFHTCSTCKKFTFGSGLKTLGKKTNRDDAKEGMIFVSYSALEEVTFKGLTPPTFYYASNSAAYQHIFYNCSKLAHIYVPAESVDLYKAADGFAEYASKIEAIPE